MKKDSYQVGFNILGPIFESYCFKLWIASLTREDDCAILFLSRGGFQLKRFYEKFLKKYSLHSPCPLNKFYISRIAAYKAGLALKDDYSIDKILENYQWESIEATFESILPNTVYKEWKGQLDLDIQTAFSENLFNRGIFLAVLEGKYDDNKVIKSYLQNQLRLLRSQLSDLSSGKKLLLLADTGWSGTILGSLANIIEDHELVGMFFGRSSYGENIEQAYFQDIIGVEVEAKDFNFKQPKSVILLYRHLIESVCEVDWPSVTGFSLVQGKVVSENQGQFIENFVDNEPILSGILDYLSVAQNSKLSQGSIFRSAQIAYKDLFRLISFPDVNTINSLNIADRSADMGKEFSVPVLLPRQDKLKGKIDNLKNSLWVPGQMVIEFDNKLILKFCQALYLMNKNLRVWKG